MLKPGIVRVGVRSLEGAQHLLVNVHVIVDGCVGSSNVVGAHHVTKHNTPIHNILSTAHQLSISQKALETLPENGSVMPKHVVATIYNK
jgi:hypothetical protein